MVAVPTDTAGAGSVVMVAVATRPHSRGSWFTRRILHRVQVDNAASAEHMAAICTRGGDVIDVLVVACMALPHVVGVAHIDGSSCREDLTWELKVW